MSLGYSTTPLAKKLGLKTNHSILLYHPPQHYFSLFEDLPHGIHEMKEIHEKSVDFIHVFCISLEELNAVIDTYKPALKLDGTFWVSWPKGSSNISTNIKREPLRALVLKKGLVDIKVAAIDKDWSGLKFVYRLKDRS